MRGFCWFVGGSLALFGCALAPSQGTGTAPLGAAGAQGGAVVSTPSAPTPPVVSPYVPGESPIMLPPPPPYSPVEPCIGGEVSFHGKGEPNERFVLWLRGDEALRSSGYPPSDEHPELLGEAVRLGEVVCDAQGAYGLTVKLPPRLEDGEGHALRLVPGKIYSVLRTTPEKRALASFTVLTLAKTACVPLPSAAPLSLALEPPDVCGDRPTVVRGGGFGGTTATLVLREEVTRFGDGPQTSLEVPVDAAGNVAYPLRPETILGADGQPFLSLGGIYFLRLFDHETQQWLERALTVCQSDLSAALSAPSIPFEPGLIVGGAGKPSDVSENAVLRSAEALSAFLGRHGLVMPPEPLAVDWGRQQVVAVFVAAPLKPWGTYPEVVAISEEGAGYRVRAVNWKTLQPYKPGPRGHLLTMAKSDRPVVFAPLVEAYEDQRGVVQPAQPRERPKWLF